ncbi:MAG: hypothetical protein WA902_17600 [Thermosynechococcaceae cyanobacterium]
MALSSATDEITEIFVASSSFDAMCIETVQIQPMAALAIAEQFELLAEQGKIFLACWPIFKTRAPALLTQKQADCKPPPNGG